MSTPHGFQRTDSGWLEATPDPKRKQIASIKQENAALKSQLDGQAAMMAELTAKVEELAAKKGKK